MVTSLSLAIQSSATCRSQCLGQSEAQTVRLYLFRIVAVMRIVLLRIKPVIHYALISAAGGPALGSVQSVRMQSSVILALKHVISKTANMWRRRLVLQRLLCVNTVILNAQLGAQDLNQTSVTANQTQQDLTAGGDVVTSRMVHSAERSVRNPSLPMLRTTVPTATQTASRDVMALKTILVKMVAWNARKLCLTITET